MQLPCTPFHTLYTRRHISKKNILSFEKKEGNLPLAEFLDKLKGREGVLTRSAIPGQLFIYM